MWISNLKRYISHAKFVKCMTLLTQELMSVHVATKKTGQSKNVKPQCIRRSLLNSVYHPQCSFSDCLWWSNFNADIVKTLLQRLLFAEQILTACLLGGKASLNIAKLECPGEFTYISKPLQAKWKPMLWKCFEIRCINKSAHHYQA